MHSCLSSSTISPRLLSLVDDNYGYKFFPRTIVEKYNLLAQHGYKDDFLSKLRSILHYKKKRDVYIFRYLIFQWIIYGHFVLKTGLGGWKLLFQRATILWAKPKYQKHKEIRKQKTTLENCHQQRDDFDINRNMIVTSELDRTADTNKAEYKS